MLCYTICIYLLRLSTLRFDFVIYKLLNDFLLQDTFYYSVLTTTDDVYNCQNLNGWMEHVEMVDLRQINNNYLSTLYDTNLLTVV